MDSGSHVDVMPESELPHVKVKPCSGARRVRRMVAANGTPIPESDEKRFRQPPTMAWTSTGLSSLEE